MNNNPCTVCAPPMLESISQQQLSDQKTPSPISYRNLNVSQMRNMMIDDELRNEWIHQNRKIIRQLSIILKSPDEKVVKFLYKLSLSNFSKALNQKPLAGNLPCGVPLMNNNSCGSYLSIFDKNGNIRDPLDPESLWNLFRVMQIFLNQFISENEQFRRTLFEVIDSKAPRLRNKTNCFGGCDPTGIFKQKKTHNYYSIDGRLHDLNASDLIGYGAHITSSKTSHRRLVKKVDISESKAKNVGTVRQKGVVYDDDYEYDSYDPHEASNIKFSGNKEMSHLEEVNQSHYKGRSYKNQQYKNIDRIYENDQYDNIDRNYRIDQYNNMDSIYEIYNQNITDSSYETGHHKASRSHDPDRHDISPHKEFPKLRTLSKSGHEIIEVLKKVNRGGLVVEDINELIRAIKMVELARDERMQHIKFEKQKQNYHEEQKTIIQNTQGPSETPQLVQQKTDKLEDSNKKPGNKYKGTNDKYLGDVMPVLVHEPFDEDKPWTWLKRHPKQARFTDGQIMQSGIIKRYRRDSVEKTYQKVKRRISFQSTISKFSYNTSPIFGASYKPPKKTKKRDK